MKISKNSTFKPIIFHFTTEHNLNYSEDNRLDFGALLKSIIGSFKKHNRLKPTDQYHEDPGFSKRGSEYRGGSLKQGDLKAQPPCRSYGVFYSYNTKIIAVAIATSIGLATSATDTTKIFQYL